MPSLKNNVVAQFAVLVLAVSAGQLILKYLAPYLPDSIPLVSAFKAQVEKL